MPGQIALDRLLDFLITAEIRRRHGKLLERREVALNAVEPRGVGGREVKLNVVRQRP